MGLPHEIKANSTLNEKLDIQAGVLPAANDTPKMKYWAIGIGGHTFTVGANGISKPEVVQHRGTNAALYRQLPFVLRAINNDLSSTERLKYALRRKEIHQGQEYIAYYLRRMDTTAVTVAMEYVTVSEGVSTVSAFVPNSNNLSPVPPDLNPSGVNVVSGDYTSATAKIGLLLNQVEVDEFLNVAQVMFEDESYAFISEMALCSGVDKVVESPAANNATINVTDAVGVQVVTFVNVFYPMKFSNTGLEVLMDVGSTEPIFALE